MEDFKLISKYGMKVYVSDNPELTSYVNKIIQQLQVWLVNNTISKLVIVIKSKDTLEVLERWSFDVNINGDNGLPMAENIPPEEAQIIQQNTVKQIRTILRQITASVSFLPELNSDDCGFNVLVYANKDVEVPLSWGDCGPNLIAGGGEHVRLKSFNTLVHKVDTFVAYKMDPSHFTDEQ
ncbi:Mitotic spindle checkpoint component mad2 [Choanephora cucurbitarum]|uniref:Mitotic spindle checkpoint component mad2 n=1 Tax=Choanephora cucurbitarum TaxID=101091 RepID=A0A1C7N561_9FUNG|nr:Mitotic spindle checkpoint component mad2 [Choanephora cucurbitarum]